MDNYNYNKLNYFKRVAYSKLIRAQNLLNSYDKF